LKGRRILVTAGPTREYLDPVRFLTNASSGQMGYALARAARRAGAVVTLISGPVHLTPPSGVRMVSVVSAMDMLHAVLKQAFLSDIFIGAAAVADWRPAVRLPQKIKKKSIRGRQSVSIKMLQNPDILQEISRRRTRGKPWTVGFALETENLLRNARRKLQDKELDMIVANPHTVIDRPHAEAYFLFPGEQPVRIRPRTKDSMAAEILSAAARRYL
jgi:phosphopantothenoylcysteine decarboxylase / phosphopantothenate---cysteine ligase